MHYFQQAKTSKELIIHIGPHESHSSLFVWHTVHMTGSGDSDTTMLQENNLKVEKHTSQLWITL